METAVDHVVPVAQQPSPRPRAARRVARILVADDDEEMRSLLEEILREEGYLTVGAADALGALIAIMRSEADLLVTDWKMPARDGLALLASVRRCAPDLPVVFITAFAHPDLERRALEQGARSFLAKPFQRSEFLAHIQAALRGTRSPA